jgi:hypothetical protein
MAKNLKKTVTIAYTYKLEAANQKGIDYLIKSLLASPSYGFGGGGSDCDWYMAELKNGKGKLVQPKAATNEATNDK